MAEVIVGIDPGITQMGVAILNQNGHILATDCIATSNKLSLGERLVVQQGRLDDLLEFFTKDNITIVGGIESVHLRGKYTTSYLKLATSYGGGVTALTRASGFAPQDIAPATINSWLSIPSQTKSKQRKQLIKDAMCERFGNQIHLHKQDTIDAIAIARCIFEKRGGK